MPPNILLDPRQSEYSLLSGPNSPGKAEMSAQRTHSRHYLDVKPVVTYIL